MPPVLGLPRTKIDKTTFPLPSEFAQKLESMSIALYKGPGVAVLRGLDAANFNDEEAVIAFVGICAYVAPLRATDSYANQTLSKYTSSRSESSLDTDSPRPHSRRDPRPRSQGG